MIKLKTFSVLALLIFASCKLTEQKAKKQLVKIESGYSYLFANPCARLYPIQERVEIEKELIQGETKYITDTQYVDCNDTENKGKNVAVPCVSTHRIDTFKQTETIVKESTAKVDVCRQHLQDVLNQKTQLKIDYEKRLTLKDALIVKQAEVIDAYKKIERTFWWIVGIALGALIVICALKFNWIGKIWKIIKNIF